MAITQPTPAKQGVRARERNALERITELEQSFSMLYGATQESFRNNDKNVAELIEVVSALVRAVGTEQVAEILKTIQAEKLEKEAAADKADIDTKLVNGELIPGSVVVPTSVVTGTERNEDGTEVAPGFVKLDFANVKPEYQTKLLALKVGDTFDTENGRKFEITGIYEPAAKEEAAE